MSSLPRLFATACTPQPSRCPRRWRVQPTAPCCMTFRTSALASSTQTVRCGAEAPGISVFTGCFAEMIRHAVAAGVVEDLRDGDGALLSQNDPYATGTHLSDVSVYMPIFAEGDWWRSGSRPRTGRISVRRRQVVGVHSTDVYQEGICFTNQHLFRADGPNHQLLRPIEQNVRLPETVLGDLDAQVAACRRGRERVQALCSRVRSPPCATRCTTSSIAARKRCVRGSPRSRTAATAPATSRSMTTVREPGRGLRSR